MATEATVNERLAAITAAGTSIWLDQIRRSMTQGGELERMVREESLHGETSNPAIFEKAILGAEDYDEQIERMAHEGADARAIYQAIAIQDVQEAADVLRVVYDDTGGYDGYVSLEVDPDIAFDTQRTMEQAREYWGRVDRPNVMIKIPGTDEGLPAIEQMTYEGLNINITLLFKVEQYERVMEAYIRGLERRHEEGKSVDVHSVASFFVSRVDTEVDKRLENMDPPASQELYGTAGLANARAAYQRFKAIFHGERFAALLEAGAPVQRPLWASTGVKNPAYPETMYVDGLIAPETVNTMPVATLLAAGEHAEIDPTHPSTADQDPTADLQALAQAGIDMTDVTDKLLRDGVDAFVTPMEKLLAGIESKREAIVTGRPATIEAWLPEELEPAVSARAQKAIEAEVAQRIWRKDDTLWGEHGAPEVGNRLGWLTISETMREELPDLQAFAKQAAADGLTDCVLLGMGGSSLAPEVFRRSFGVKEGALRLHVLDSTDAAAIRAVEDAIDIDKTLFLVSSKSGGTIETLSQFKHFWSRKPDGDHFAAITDPGSGLADLATEHGFRRVFLNDPDIGGRYSALSYFGLVPAALMGADVEALLDGAGQAEQACAHYETQANSGLWLGIALGELSLHGRDKLTFIVDEPLDSFGLWAEQLVAESTGKQGKGIVPVADEPVGSPDVYGDDRVFVHLCKGDDNDEEVNALRDAGQAVVTLSVGGPEDLGRIFFFAEFATAVAGWVLGINPFDQPNVQEAKDATKRVLESGGADPDDGDVADVVRSAPPSYVAIMGYVQPTPEFDAAVRELRAVLRDATKQTTTFGYGPRFLHSTGQLHKGGPKTGSFLQLIHDGPEDVEIPGEAYSFTTLKHAQADGDLETLRAHGL
ncbi:MAG: bifunctional transaldolase/phosoglucose isomerase, partial [Actinobacteria bacterium]